MKFNYQNLILGSAVLTSAILGGIFVNFFHPISSLYQHQKQLGLKLPPYPKNIFTQSGDSSAIIGRLGGEGATLSTRFFGASDKVFSGKVIGFTPSQWTGNKSGPQTVQEWENTSQQVFHEVILQVDEPILGVSKGQQIKLIRSGNAPGKPAKIGNVAYVWSAPEDEDHKEPAIGDAGIFFVASQMPVYWNPKKSVATAKRANVSLGYFPSQKSGQYLSSLPEDAKLERCSSLKKTGVLQTQTSADDFDVNPSVNDSANLCATRRLYTVKDVRQKLKEFEITKACLKRHRTARYPVITHGITSCDKERRIRQGLPLFRIHSLVKG